MGEDIIEVLMMEDDPGDVKLTRQSLKESKLHICLNTVGDGKEGMDYLKKVGKYASAKTPQLIILDLNMPRMDGRQVLHAIKHDDDIQLKKIPVVILTTSQEEEDITKSYLEGANCYITKPVDFEQFQKVVKEIYNFWFTIVKLPDSI